VRFITIFALFLLTSPACAQSLYLNYGQWEQMPTSFREMYVAGAFDALSTIAIPAQAKIARHYNECVTKAGLSTGQIAENMKAYATTQPNLQNKPVPGVLMRYLISLCGTPAGETPWQGW
jgi:hypothetical protein